MKLITINRGFLLYYRSNTFALVAVGVAEHAYKTFLEPPLFVATVANAFTWGDDPMSFMLVFFA